MNTLGHKNTSGLLSLPQYFVTQHLRVCVHLTYVTQTWIAI